MALSKKEREELEKVQQDTKLGQALCWPTFPKPVPMTPKEIEEACKKSPDRVAVGWFINSHGHALYNRITQGCSNGHNHSRHDTRRTNSQGAGTLYSSKEKGLLALRWELCEMATKELVTIDEEIYRLATGPTTL